MSVGRVIGALIQSPEDVTFKEIDDVASLNLLVNNNLTSSPVDIDDDGMRDISLLDEAYK